MMRMVIGGLGRRRQLLHTLISKEIIKPSSPTPSHLKTYNLSLLDQYTASVYVPVVFFYPNNPSSTISNQAKAAQLKKSLSQTLTRYYPFSGRLVVASTNGAAYVDCNDEGVEFLEVRSDASLSKLLHLHNLDYQPLDQFFPTGSPVSNRPSNNICPVAVQLTYFACGGIAIAVSMSHKIGDGSTLLTFVHHWAGSCANKNVQVQLPHIVSSPEADFSSLQEHVMRKGNCVYVTKSFVFPNSKLAELKDKLKEIKPTRNEVLTALIYGAAVRAAEAKSQLNSFKGYILVYAVNLRKRMVNPLPDTYVGNMYRGVIIPTMTESELAMNSLTARIKNAKLQVKGVTRAQMDQWVIQAVEGSRNVISKNDFGIYACSSVCGFPAYEVDFGWGKPIKMSIEGSSKHFFIFMDTPNRDGIEVVVTLEEEDMAIFQNDKQLLAFAL